MLELTLAGFGLIVLGLRSWYLSSKMIAHAFLWVVYVLLGVFVLGWSALTWIWLQPDNVRTLVWIAGTLLIVMWTFTSLPVFFLYRRLHISPWLQACVFAVPVVLIGVLLVTAIYVGPLEAIWAMGIVGLLSGVYLFRSLQSHRNHKTT